MLEVFLELLWSKTLSAPSFGRIWKQLIRSTYWFLQFYPKKSKVSSKLNKIIEELLVVNFQLMGPWMLPKFCFGGCHCSTESCSFDVKWLISDTILFSPSYEVDPKFVVITQFEPAILTLRFACLATWHHCDKTGHRKVFLSMIVINRWMVSSRVSS